MPRMAKLIPLPSRKRLALPVLLAVGLFAVLAGRSSVSFFQLPPVSVFRSPPSNPDSLRALSHHLAG